jgi:sugar lactone lactonase YvrE
MTFAGQAGFRKLMYFFGFPKNIWSIVGPSYLADGIFKTSNPRFATRPKLIRGLLVAAATTALAGVGAAQQYSLTTPVGTINEPVGTKSGAQTAAVKITVAGTLSSIVVLTEGINNKDFQLSSYSCSPNAQLTLGQICTIGYTFQPQYAGLRRGGISLNDSNGNPLGVAYIAGFGTGPQVATYAASGGGTIPQLVVSQSVGGQIAVDGAGNIYYNLDQGGGIYKATPNADGSYSSTLIASPSGLVGSAALAVDGLGNVYFNDLVVDLNSQTLSDCAIGRLTPGNSGYTQSDPIVFSSHVAPICPYLLAVDGAGTIYYDDYDQLNLGYESFNAGSYSNTTIAQVPDRRATDLAVDPEHNLYWADCGGDGLPYVNVDEIFPWNPTKGSYGTAVNGGYSFAYDGDYGEMPNYFGYQCGVAPSNAGGYWMSDQSPDNLGTTAAAAIYYFAPQNGTLNYTAQQFSAALNTLPAAIRTDAQGNLYFRNEDGGSTLGIYKISISPSITYPSTNAGYNSAAQDLIVLNFGTSTLDADGSGYTLPSFISQASGNSANGLADCSTSFTLAPLVSCALDTQFNAADNATGLSSGNIAVYTNSDNVSTTNTIPVQATAIQPVPTVTGISPSSGSSLGGTTVTIVGTALGDVSAVSFNSTPAQSFSLISETEMQVVVPAGTAGQSATLKLTSLGGTTTTGTAVWSWNQLPSTTASTLSLASNTVALTGTTTLTATIMAGSSAVPNELVTFHSSNPSVAAAPASTTTNASGIVTAIITGTALGSTTFTATMDGETLSNAPVLHVSSGTEVGSTVTGETAQVTITKGGTLSGVQMLNKGTNSGDWTLTSQDCTNGSVLAATRVCNIGFSFSPTEPGLRQGAIMLTGSGGSTLGETFISGVGVGPQGEFSTGTLTLMEPYSGNWDSVAFDDAGNVYAADANWYEGDTGPRLWKFPPSGTATTITQDPEGGMTGIAVDGAGNIFYGDLYANEIYELPGGTGTAVAIAAVTNPGTNMTTDGAGNIYVGSSQQLIKIDAVTHATTVVASVPGTVGGVAVDVNGDIFYTDSSKNNIYEIPDGSTTGSVISTGVSDPAGIAIDAAGDLYVASPNKALLYRLSAGTYAVSTVSSISKELPESGWQFSGVVVDRLGNIYSAVPLTDNGQATGLLVGIARNVAQPIAFPTTPALSTSAASQVQFENDGNTVMTIASYSSSAQFGLASVANGCALGELAAGASCEMGLTFAPAAAGSFTGTGTMVDSANQSYSVALSGRATAISQTLTFLPPPSTAVIGTQVTLGATASSGLAVIYTVSGPATLNGSTLSYTGGGTVVITATQPGNGAYTAATPIKASMLVSETGSTGAGAIADAVTVPINFSGTLGQVLVLTQGAPNQDFQLASGGTCTTGTAYTGGQSCTVSYTFAATAPGMRKGAVILEDGSGDVLGSAYVDGVGVGAQALFTTGVSTNVASRLEDVRSVSVDGAGDIYVTEDGGSVEQFAAGTNVDTHLTSVGYGTAGTAVDGAGNLYFGQLNTGILEMAGIFGEPTQIASGWSPDNTLLVDGSGNLYSADQNTGAIYEIAAGTRAVTTLLAGGQGHRFIGMAIDASNNLYAADYNNNIMYEVVAGSGTATVLFSGNGLNSPQGLAIDPAGDLYVTNTGGDGNVLRYAAGTYTHTELPTGYATVGIAIDASGNLLTLDGSNIERYTRTATPALSFGTTTVGATVAAQTTSIENDGDEPLILSALATPSSSFKLDPATTTCSTTAPLPIGGVCNVGATFTPQTVGASTSTFSITDNSLNVAGSLQQVALTGTGSMGEPVVSVTNTSIGYAVSSTTLTTAITYGGVQPTGAVTFQVDSGASVTASCTVGSGSETCSASYNSLALPPGSHSVTATIAADTNYDAASNTGTLTVNDALASFTVTGIPTAANPGTAYTATVTAIGVSGETFTAFNGIVALSSTDPLAAFLPMMHTYQPTDNGVHNFTVTFGTAGTQTITATSGSTTGSETGIVVNDLIWVVNGNGTVSELTVSGIPLLSGIGTPTTASTLGGTAIDSSGGVWSVTSGSNTLNYVSKSGTGATSYTGGGLNAPTSVAVDGNSRIWVTNGNGTISLFSNNGAPLSPPTGYTGNTSSPGGIAIDTSGNVWISNTGNNTVTQVLGTAAPAAPLSSAVTNLTTGQLP